MLFTNDDIQEIIRIMDASFQDELHLETSHFRISLRKATGERSGWTQEIETLRKPNLIYHKAKQPEFAEKAEAQAEQDIAANPAPSAAGLLDILPPLLGTFYRSPKPGAPPFVEIGSKVEADTIVGIVETMKLMNPVAAQVHGIVAEICVADGQSVEADRVLMRVWQETA